MKKRVINLGKMQVEVEPDKEGYLTIDADRALGMGNALAMIISWSLHKHIGWAMLHGFFGWFYVLFYWLSSQ